MKKVIHTFVVLAYKESDLLETCIKSVLDQKYKSKVVIGTSTPNEYIKKIAEKYELEIKINKEAKHRIGDDFDFAIKCSDTQLVTIAHQDDFYEPDYSHEIVKAFEENKDAIILFSDYYEIRANEKEYNNTNLKIKRILLKPLLNRSKANLIKTKRKVLKYGNAISCPAVTFNTKKVEFPVFDCDFKADVDWNAWERLSKVDGSFIFIDKMLMGHTVSVETTTTKIINSGIRTREDYEMFKRFWPIPVAKLINIFYKNAEKSNNTKKEKN